MNMHWYMHIHIHQECELKKYYNINTRKSPTRFSVQENNIKI